MVLKPWADTMGLGNIYAVSLCRELLFSNLMLVLTQAIVGPIQRSSLVNSPLAHQDLVLKS